MPRSDLETSVPPRDGGRVRLRRPGSLCRSERAPDAAAEPRTSVPGADAESQSDAERDARSGSDRNAVPEPDK